MRRVFRQHNAFGIVVLLCMGLARLHMVRQQIAEAPFPAAFVPGLFFADNLRRFLLISHGAPGMLWSTPVCCLFIALTMLSLGIALRKKWRHRMAAPVLHAQPGEA